MSLSLCMHNLYTPVISDESTVQQALNELMSVASVSGDQYLMAAGPVSGFVFYLIGAVRAGRRINFLVHVWSKSVNNSLHCWCPAYPKTVHVKRIGLLSEWFKNPVTSVSWIWIAEMECVFWPKLACWNRFFILWPAHMLCSSPSPLILFCTFYHYECTKCPIICISTYLGPSGSGWFGQFWVERQRADSRSGRCVSVCVCMCMCVPQLVC